MNPIPYKTKQKQTLITFTYQISVLTQLLTATNPNQPLQSHDKYHAHPHEYHRTPSLVWRGSIRKALYEMRRMAFNPTYAFHCVGKMPPRSDGRTGQKNRQDYEVGLQWMGKDMKKELNYWGE